MNKTVYLDNAATTPIHPDVIEAMMPYFKNIYYNPSAKYDGAYTAKKAIDSARGTIAGTIGCEPNEIYFTSGGTESDNWALRFVKPGGHIITSKIEHHAILHTCEYLKKCGVEVTYLDVDEYGLIDLIDLESKIKSNTNLISIMFANNEIGTIQPISAISEIAADNNIVFHTDAVQAYGHKGIDVNDLGIDMMSVSAHKFNGPKGVGFLYVSNRIPMDPMIYGGDQQFGMRSGTENVPGIVGMEKAAEIAFKNLEDNNDAERSLRDYMLNRILLEIPDVKINGSVAYRLSNNLNMSFGGVRGEQLLFMLSMNGICASTGSACNASSNDPSHVLKAIGLSDRDANSSIRFTLSANNSQSEIDYTVDILKQCVSDLRTN